MINSRVPSDIVVGKGSLLMGCDIVVRGGAQLTSVCEYGKHIPQCVEGMLSTVHNRVY